MKYIVLWDGEAVHLAERVLWFHYLPRTGWRHIATLFNTYEGARNAIRRTRNRMKREGHDPDLIGSLQIISCKEEEDV